jgi:hypothetical protein
MKVTQELIDRINENIENARVELRLVKKNNIEKEGLTIIFDGNEIDEETIIYPTIYIDDLDDFNDVLSRINSVLNQKLTGFDMDQILSKEYILDNVRACLVSKDNIMLQQNNVTYREFLDMAIIYRIIVPYQGEMGSVLVFNYMLENIGIAEQDLFEVAKASNNYDMNNLFKVVMELMHIEEQELEEYPEIYVLSAKDKYFGASVLITNLFEELIRKSKQSYYIIPSSVHEILLVPYQEIINPEKLVELVRFVNATEVSPEDKLTDSVYYIDEDGIRKVA